MHQLQSLLAQVLRLTTEIPSSLYQIFIYRTTVLLQLHKFWDTIQDELSHKNLYITSIRAIKIRLSELCNEDKKAKKLKTKGLPESWENFDKILHYQNLFYIPKVIHSEFISNYHNNPLIDHFGNKKIQKLIVKKYY